MRNVKAQRRYMIILDIVLIIALICGIVGLLIAGETIIDSIFHTLMMFTLAYFWEPANVLVNIARYLAAFFTFSAIVALVFSAFQILLDRIRGMKKNSTYIYGDNEIAKEYLAKNKKAIHGIHGFVEADNYILLDTEEKNLIFCMEHRDDLKGKRVFMKTENLPGVLYRDKNLRSFSPEELAGRKLWDYYDLIDKAYDENGNPRKLTVSLIGWGKLGEQILFYGLMANSFADVTYHIFGDSHVFEMLHADHLEDLGIQAYETDWYDHIDVIKKSDMIIIAEQKNQIQLINSLFMVSSELRVVVCAAFRGDEANKKLLLQNRAGTIPAENLTFYNWTKASRSLEALKKEERLLNADLDKEDFTQKKLRRRIQQEWASMDTFRRYAYLNLLDLHQVYDKMRKVWGDRVTKEELLRLVHNRVLHYYWYHNWNYSPLPDPDHPEKELNEVKRLTRRLRPLEELSEEEKDKEYRIVQDVLDSFKEEEKAEK